MAQQKKGLIARLLEGKEKSEEYARSTLPTNRWQLFWDIFKGNFGKLVKVNLLTLIFFIPMLAVIVIGVLMRTNTGLLYPFGSNVGIGAWLEPDMRGVSQYLNLQYDFVMYAGVLLSSIIASVGLAGGMYVIRNMVWTEGIFVANDFWRGVKLNFKNALQTALLFCTVLILAVTMIDFAEMSLAIETTKVQEVFLRISEGASVVLIILAMMITLWMIALGVNYQMKFFALVRNAFVLSIGTFPQTIFFGVLALLPVALFFLYQIIATPLIIVIAAIVLVLVGFAYALLVWLDFAQWVFDKYINPKIEGAKVGRGIYNKDGTSTVSADSSAASLEYQRIILSHGRSRLVARPIKPIDDSLQVYELPQSFTREDLKKLRESKQNIEEDTEAYAEEHKNDLRYVEYNRQFDERERALQEAESKGRKKKPRKPPKMLGE